jgi:hypothetical protein
MGGCVPATIVGCILPYPNHEHSANEVETHSIKHLVHHLYLIMRHWTLCRRQIIHKSLQIRIQ